MAITKQLIRVSTPLIAIAVLSALLLAWIYDNSKQRAADNEKTLLEKRLLEIFPANLYDNDLLADVQQLPQNSSSFPLSSLPLMVYRAYLRGQFSGVIFDLTTDQGYNGKIKLLLGINASGDITGVRVYSHNETPGLGDDLDIQRSDWINTFNGKNLASPASPFAWKVKKDNGDFDQFTGATITPRAIVTVVHQALLYFDEHKAELKHDK